MPQVEAQALEAPLQLLRPEDVYRVWPRTWATRSTPACRAPGPLRLGVAQGSEVRSSSTSWGVAWRAALDDVSFELSNVAGFEQVLKCGDPDAAPPGTER